MQMTWSIGALIVCFCLVDVSVQSETFLKAAKKIPRMGRSRPPTDFKDPRDRNEALERFFLKASKSVPRIGRRGPPVNYYSDEAEKYIDFNYKRPVWADISERLEFEPEIFGNPQLLEEYETALADDPLVYDIPSRMRYKRGIPALYKHKQ